MTLQAQSKKALKSHLLQDLEAYKTYALAQDFEKSLQFMPAKMFDIVPRDSLMDLMQQSMENEMMKIALTGMNYQAPQKIKVKKAGAYHWALVGYDAEMHFVMKEKDHLPLVIPAMKAAFGRENVVVEENGMVIQLTDKYLIAFKDAASSQWYFIEDKRKSKEQPTEMQKMIFETVLPDEVKKAVGI